MKLKVLVLPALVILAVNVVRFTGLSVAPPGVHTDESIDSVEIQCLATEGVNASGIRYPFFSVMNHITKPPNYLYPGIVWVKVFGASAESLRAFSAFFIMTAVIGLFFLGGALFGIEYGAWLALAGSLSPWMWPVSRVGYDSLVSVPFLVWGLYFLFRSNRWHDHVGAGILLLGSMYGYATFRMAVPLMLPFILLYKYRRDGFRWKPFIALVITMTALFIPLVMVTLKGTFSSYFDSVSIFSRDFLASIGSSGSFSELWNIYWHIYALHLAPEYLFGHGGGSVIYLTRFCGLFGWLDMIALAGALAWFIRLGLHGWGPDKERRHIWFVLTGLAAFFIGIVPAGFTQYNVPSLIRTSPAWPFAMMLGAFFLWRWSCKIKGIAFGFLGGAVLFASLYLNDYFVNYPRINQMDFGVPYYQMAVAAKTPVDWAKFVVACGGDGVRARYYLMMYNGMTCSQANDFYMTVSGHFHSRGW